MDRIIFKKILKNYNPSKNKKTLILFDDILADTLSNRKLKPIVTELFPRDRNLNISLVFITQFKITYFALGKAFVKQKTIENNWRSRKNTLKTLEELRKQLVKSSGEKESLTLLNQKKIFEEFTNERMGEIQNLSKLILLI